MKKVIKHESILGFIEDVSLYKTGMNRNGSRDPMSCSYIEIQSEILIRNDQGIDPGDKIEFHYDELTNVTRQSVSTKVVYECIPYDDISNKLIKK